MKKCTGDKFDSFEVGDHEFTTIPSVVLSVDIPINVVRVMVPWTGICF